MSEPPKISVIVPVYGVEAYLPRCVDSLLAQTFGDFEVLLVDDGSPDRCGAICDEYADKDSRIKVFHKANGGVASARQCGMEHAQGVYTIHCDPDDWVEPTMLERFYAKAIAEEADVVITGFFLDGKTTCREVKQPFSSCEPREVIRGVLMRRLTSSLCNKLVRRTLYTDHSVAFLNGIDYGEDCYVLCRLLLHADKCVFLDETFYHYCANASSITSSRFRRKCFEDRFCWIRELERSFAGDPELLDALDCMKLFVKQDAYRSGLYTQQEFDSIYPESVVAIDRGILRLHDRLLLQLACRGYASFSMRIFRSRSYGYAVGVARIVRDFFRKRI